jgi:ubiquinone/menaquinone biosynthesis C-methylase UbiE
MSPIIKLKFSEKYDQQHATQYLIKHQDGLARRLSHKRDEQLARRALQLAGEPQVVLDLPCGAGRFWPLLAQMPNREIIGADNSASMLEVASLAQPAEVVKRVRRLQMSAFEIDLPDNSVDSVFCMRLLHHIGDASHRMALLRELHRVSRDSVIISLWLMAISRPGNASVLSVSALQRQNNSVTKIVLCYLLLQWRRNSKRQASPFRIIWTLFRSTRCGGFTYYERDNS